MTLTAVDLLIITAIFFLIAGLINNGMYNYCRTLNNNQKALMDLLREIKNK